MKTLLMQRLLPLALLAALLMTTAPTPQAAPAESKPLRHIVIFKFKPEATPAQIDEIVKEFALLPTKIDGITDFEWGTANSPEKLDQGFTHCFLVTFKDEQARENYLPHAAHQAFVAKLKPILDAPFVFDYWAK